MKAHYFAPFCLAALPWTLSTCASVQQEPIQAEVTPESAEWPAFDEFWDYGDPAGTESKFREVLAASEGAPLDYRTQLLTQIARCNGLQRKFDEAHALLNSVDTQLLPQRQDASEDPTGLARVRYWLERGRTFRSGGEPEKSGPLFERAFQYSNQLGADVFTIDAAHMLALIGDAENKEKWSILALDLARASNDERARGWQGALTNNLGWSKYDEGKFDEALQLFEENRQYWAARGADKRTLIAKWSYAKTLRALGRAKKALSMQFELVEEWKQLGQEDGYVWEELGECTLALEGELAARSHFAKAYELLSADEWLRANEKARLDRMAQLAGQRPTQ